MPMPIKVGLLVDDVYCSKYVLELVRWAQASSDIQITHLIVHANVKPKVRRFSKWAESLSSHGFLATADRLLARAVIRVSSFIERRLIKRSRHDRDHVDVFDLSTIVPKLDITPQISKSGFVYRFSNADIERVKSLDLDLLIRCGGPILRGPILNTAKYGVWSFHHADNTINRGGPAGFWEVFYEHNTTGFMIQRLSEELDGGDVMMRGRVQTQYYYFLNQAALYRKSNHYLKVLLSQLAKGKHPAFLEPTPYSYRLFKEPGARIAVLYLVRLVSRIAMNNFRKVRGVAPRWSVGFVKGDWRRAVLWRATHLKNPTNHFLADPFVVSCKGDNFCFVEDFDYRVGKGVISVYKLDEDGGSHVGVALKEPFHLSFPYIFEFAGNLYMCPETTSDRSIRVYKCTGFPLEWTLEKILMKNVAAADSMLIERGDKWWLLTNTDPGWSDDFFELSVFSANSPLSDRWQPHPQNPIYVDARWARNGGLLRDGDRIFRVCQSQGFNLYGKAAHIREIIQLSETAYEERDVGELVPQFAKGVVGTHHMHSNGVATVFDLVGSSKISS